MGRSGKRHSCRFILFCCHGKRQVSHPRLGNLFRAVRHCGRDEANPVLRNSETPHSESNTRPAETDATKRVPPVLYGENDTRHTTYVCRLSILLSFPAFQLFSWCEAPRFSADAKHLHSRAEIGRRVKLQNTETPRGESKIRPVPRFPGYSVITWK